MTIKNLIKMFKINKLLLIKMKTLFLLKIKFKLRI